MLLLYVTTASVFIGMYRERKTMWCCYRGKACIQEYRSDLYCGGIAIMYGWHSQCMQFFIWRMQASSKDTRLSENYYLHSKRRTRYQPAGKRMEILLCQQGRQLGL